MSIACQLIKGLNPHYLTSLSLEDEWFEPPTSDFFSALTRLSRLTDLRLSGCQIEDGMIQPLLQSMPFLSHVRLRGHVDPCTIRDEGALDITNLAPNLTHLDLEMNEICEGSLAIALNMKHLTYLNLGSNLFENDMIIQIAPHLTKTLRHLMLRDCGVKSSGAEAIATHASQLVSLDLSMNKIKKKGARFLADKMGHDLRKLYLHDNRISPEGVAYLQEKLSHLETLTVYFNVSSTGKGCIFTPD